MYDLLIKNAKVMTFNQKDEILNKAHIIVKNEKIIDIINSDHNLPEARETHDNKGNLLTPGLIDCHTHVIYGGDRANEFELRLKGASYEELAKKGAGILSTVKATRQASEEELFLSAKKRLLQMMSFGTTTCEVKSGYGLNFETELKMLNVAKKLNENLPLSLVSTFLGAHALPPEFHSKDEYINSIVHEILPVLAEKKLCQFVDGFCETIAFSPAQIKKLFQKAKSLGFKLKLHAEQLSDQKGSVLASEMGAVSVDHLEYLSEKDVLSLKDNSTVATLLPGAFYFLKANKKPPIKALKENKIPIAIATDANPGSSPFLSLPLMMNMACTLFSLNPYEAFKGVTFNAAKALNLEKKKGSIAPGMDADFCCWSTSNYSEIICYPNYNYLDLFIKKGKEIKFKKP